MPFAFKVAVVLVLIAIVLSLGSGLIYMLKDGGQSTRTVKALTVRISLSVVLFMLLLLSYATGFFGYPQKPISAPVSHVGVENAH